MNGRRILLAAAGLVGLAAALSMLALWLATDAQPRFVASSVVATADVESAWQLLRSHDPRRARPGAVRVAVLEQRPFEWLLNHGARRWTGAAVMLRIEPGRAIVRSSLPSPLPFGGRWLNVEADLRPSRTLPAVAALQVGWLSLPGWMAWPLLARVLAQQGVAGDIDLIHRVVRRVDFQSERLFVFYAWQEDTWAAARAMLLPAVEQARLHAYSERLADLLAGERAGSTISLARLLPPLFALARQRSQAGADAAAENRAALLALAFYANRRGLHALIPAARQWRRPPALTVMLAGRTDLPLHFLVSAAIAAESGRPLADAVGIYKEVADTHGGSGFSFNDLAADRAGTRLGELAVRRADWLQQQLAAGVIERDLLPDISDLPENLSAQDLGRRFGGIDGPAYRQLLAEIEQRLDASPLLR